MKNYEIYPKTYSMSHNLTPFCCVVFILFKGDESLGRQKKIITYFVDD